MFWDVWAKGFQDIILYVAICCWKHTIALNKTFCRADFAYFTLAQFGINFSIRTKSKNGKKSVIFMMSKKWKGLFCKVTNSSYHYCVWTSDNSKCMCAPLWMRAHHCGCARDVQYTHWNFGNCLVEISKMCNETLLCMVTLAGNFELVFFHQWCQNVLLSTHISACHFLSVNKLFEWK